MPFCRDEVEFGFLRVGNRLHLLEEFCSRKCGKNTTLSKENISGVPFFVYDMIAKTLLMMGNNQLCRIILLFTA